MRLSTLASIGMLSLTLGIPALNAQDDKPRQEPAAEPRQEEAKPETKPAEPHNNLSQHENMQQDQDKQMKQDQEKMKQQEAKPANDEKLSKEEKKQQKEQEKATHNEAQQGGGHPAGGQVAGRGGHIPDDQFKSHFGRQHTVVINRPTIVEGQPRFQYSGYWFVISDPWPVGWAYTDQCYIDYIDGEYFLFDLAHPGVQIALFVVM